MPGVPFQSAPADAAAKLALPADELTVTVFTI